MFVTRSVISLPQGAYSRNHTPRTLPLLFLCLLVQKSGAQIRVLLVMVAVVTKSLPTSWERVELQPRVAPPAVLPKDNTSTCRRERGAFSTIKFLSLTSPSPGEAPADYFKKSRNLLDYDVDKIAQVIHGLRQGVSTVAIDLLSIVLASV